MEDEILLTLLPPGFRFHPTDDEIIRHYLAKKVADGSFNAVAMGEADLNRCEPWDLPKIAKMGEKAWYFFSKHDMKYPTGTRTNRATEAGYWKATGKDKEIHGLAGGRRVLVGMKKTLVFYMGRAPRGEKTSWVMHEFRLEGNTLYHNLPQDSKESWVVCRVFNKNEGVRKPPMMVSTEASVGQLQQQMNITPNQEHSTSYFSQIPPNPFLSHSATAGTSYIGHGNVDQVSNSTASRSQDATTRKELHSDISSYSSGNPSDDPFLDFDNMWMF